MITILAIVALVAAVVLPLSLTVGAWLPAVRRRFAQSRAWEIQGPSGRAERRRAENTARELLQTCLDEDSWAMYRALGFVRVWGHEGRAPAPSGRRPPPGVAYAYLVYPHHPYVVYLPQTTTLLGECRVQLAGLGPDDALAASDDLLAHWMALTGDEHGVIASARIATPGSEMSRRRIRRDLWRLREWERERAERAAATVGARRLGASSRGRATP